MIEPVEVPDAPPADLVTADRPSDKPKGEAEGDEPSPSADGPAK